VPLFRHYKYLLTTSICTNFINSHNIWFYCIIDCHLPGYLLTISICTNFINSRNIWFYCIIDCQLPGSEKLLHFFYHEDKTLTTQKTTVSVIIVKTLYTVHILLLVDPSQLSVCPVVSFAIVNMFKSFCRFYNFLPNVNSGVCKFMDC
jgi:hypothetical protein